MSLKKLLYIFVFFLLKNNSFSENIFLSDTLYIQYCDSLQEMNNQTVDLSMEIGQRPNPVLHLFKIKQKKNKKITAAFLAFPFPFGIVGLHRIYLGTAPYVPVVYIGTLGGVLGILPFIDFCVIVLDKNVDRYIENKNVLMWVDEKKTAK